MALVSSAVGGLCGAEPVDLGQQVVHGLVERVDRSVFVVPRPLIAARRSSLIGSGVTPGVSSPG
ncbi:hypothetical protein [Actinacidiphila rubida]|uniref:hypothetical protein n=1 Tax=Actinacidiphila rubida TaxID=310780 RepID=UPI001160559E|nr:hypothetical protein [Actinacidiphila rubida]